MSILTPIDIVTSLPPRKNILIHAGLQCYAHIDYAVCLTCRGVTEIIILVCSARDVNLHDKTTAETSAVLARGPFVIET